MYTDCKDPNCVKCKQASKGQSSEEGNRCKIPETVGQSSEQRNRCKIPETVGQSSEQRNQCKIPETVGQSSDQKNQCKIPETVGQSSEEESRGKLQKTLDEEIEEDMLFAVTDREDCLSTNRRLEEEVHFQINELIDALRERELMLCIEIQREYFAQMEKIDHDITVNCVNKIMKRSDENKRPSKITLGFISDFYALKKRIGCFGQLRYEVTEERNKRRIQEHREATKNFNQFWAGTECAPSALSSGYSFEVDSKATPWTINAACANPVLADPIVKNKIAILAKRREKERELIEKSSRLKEICLESKEEDLKIKFNDRHSVDLQTKKTEPKLNEENSKINFDDELPESGKTMSEDEKFIRRCQMQLLPLKENKKEYEPKLEALKKELHNKRACYLPSPRNVEPETLAFLIRQRFETLANRLVDGQRREEMALRSFESTDPVPNKEVGNDKSLLQEKDGQFQSQEELMKKDLEKPCPKLPVTDLKREKIASQSSESTDSLPSEEVEKDSSLDEDDIEIISKNETESIPSDLSFSPPLPPKNRFKFGPKPLRLSSLIRKKGDRKPPHSPRNSAKAESSGIGESESQESSFSSAVSSGSNTEMKENPSFNKQAGQESSNKCLGGSKDKGQGSNPTVALRSSFSKYLEKNPKNEWLAPLKMSEQLLPAGNGSKERVVVQRVVPIFVQELDQWLPREPNQKMTSDWLYPAHM